MNGLKYIRTRCNYSLNEIAEKVGVTRQAVSAWENGRKEVPEKRLEQLALLFGIDKKYFCEITEEDKEYLIDKAMFRYYEDGKEKYRYKPREELKSIENEPIYFLVILKCR